jgi:hypothetical protein
MTVTGTPLIILTGSSANARTITPTAVTEANSISFRIAAGTGGLTIAGTSAVRDLDFTDGTNPTGYAGALASSNFTVYGNLKFSTGMTRTAGNTGITFAATLGIKTINTAGVTFDGTIAFSGVGGTWQLQAALTLGATRICSLTNGTLDLASYTLTTGIFSSTNSNIRTLAFGTGKIVITGNNATVFTTNTVANLTITGSKRVEYSYSGSTGTRQISGPTGGSQIEGVNLCDHYILAGTDTFNINGSRAYGNVDYTGFGGVAGGGVPTIQGDLVLSSEATFSTSSFSPRFLASSGTKTITSNGKTINGDVIFVGVGGNWALQDALTVSSLLTFTSGTVQLKAGTTNTVGSFATSGTNGKFLKSTTPGSQATISAASGTFTVNYLTIQDSAATGGAVWDATAGTNVDAGNNSGWSFRNAVASGGGNITAFGFGFRI